MKLNRTIFRRFLEILFHNLHRLALGYFEGINREEEE